MCTAASSAAAAAAAAGQQLASQHIAADSSAGRRAALSFGSIGTGWRVCFAPARAQSAPPANAAQPSNGPLPAAGIGFRYRSRPAVKRSVGTWQPLVVLTLQAGELLAAAPVWL